MYKEKKKQPTWFTEEIAKLVRAKKKMYRKAKSSTNCEDLWSGYRMQIIHLRRYTIKLIGIIWINWQIIYIRMIDDKKLFWNYVSAKRKGTNELISLKGNGDEDILDDLDIYSSNNEPFFCLGIYGRGL